MVDEVLVTGASGFIAGHVILNLLQKGYRVRGTIRDLGKSQHLLSVMSAHGADLSRLSLREGNLLSDDGWQSAVNGCRYVLHMASPLPRVAPKKEDDLIIPARDGALRVLRAAVDHGVERVVMTSSVAAVLYGHARDGAEIYNETHWSELSPAVGAYEKSKTIAERAAWEFMGTQANVDFVTVNPSLVLGPILEPDYGTSGEVVRKLLLRKLPAVPDVGWAVVDVRDVANAHLDAMATPEARDKRLICSGKHTSMLDIALLLNNHFRDRGYRVPTARLPDFLLKVVAKFDKTAALAVQELGLRQDLDCSLAERTIHFKPRGLEQTVRDMAESMIKFGVV